MAVIKTLNAGELNVKSSDVFGFLNVYGEARRELEDKVDLCIAELSEVITPRACYGEYDIKIDGDKVFLGFTETVSRDLAERLEGCRKIILLAATVGIGSDRLVAKYSATEPSRALIMQAAASAAVETWLDLICAEFAASRNIRERFSCGYGDLELSLQKEIFKALSCEKNIGVTLGSACLMTPTKSVTAIIGVE